MLSSLIRFAPRSAVLAGGRRQGFAKLPKEYEDERVRLNVMPLRFVQEQWFAMKNVPEEDRMVAIAMKKLEDPKIKDIRELPRLFRTKYRNEDLTWSPYAQALETKRRRNLAKTMANKRQCTLQRKLDAQIERFNSLKKQYSGLIPAAKKTG
eukprot:GILI01016916.1.p1 GENE.GILI01016916.1~~GILI01016916.1.p1  ORF type:complete len:152 (-),score=16.04 GILI01016916.1:109-564(-)